MAHERYLVGSRQEKKVIDRLLVDKAPSLIEYNYLYLCNHFVERLVDSKVKNAEEYDMVLCEYLDEIEVDIRERLSQYHRNFLSYMLCIEESMQYFKKYLEQINYFPIPEDMTVYGGTYGTVMMVTRGGLSIW